MKAATVCVLVLTGLAAFGAATAAPAAAREAAAIVACTAPPTPGSTPDTHAKASSLAPSGHSHRRGYGAPIQRPIVSKHVKRKGRAPATVPASSR